MNYIPDYINEYPNMDSSYPLHISKNTIPAGFRQHRHNYLEFSYVIEGMGSESINNNIHPMTPGTFTFVHPYQVHEIFTSEGNTLVLYNCTFSMDLLMEHGVHDNMLSFIDRYPEHPYVHLEAPEQIHMNNLLRDMYNEYLGDNPWRQTMLQIRLKEALIMFDRVRSRGIPQHEMLQATSSLRKSNSVWPMIHYIHQHYQEDLSLSNLAMQFSLSVSRVSEVIKETTGQNFLTFLHDLRIKHACSLLVSTEMSLSEIAHEVGYGSYNTFSRTFREQKNQSPKQFRNEKTLIP